MNGKADEQMRLNYFNNTVVPCVNALVDGIKCKFLTNTAISQHQSIKWFRDPFSNTTIDKIAEMVDKFTRNEVASSNEMRSVLGWKPVDDPRADELRNKNLNASENEMQMPFGEDESMMEEQSMMNNEGSEGEGMLPEEPSPDTPIKDLKVSELARR